MKQRPIFIYKGNLLYTKNMINEEAEVTMKRRYHSITLDTELPNNQRLMVMKDRGLLDRSQLYNVPIKKNLFLYESSI